VFRITDWNDDKGEPGYDVETYMGGKYFLSESQCFTLHRYATKEQAKMAAIIFVQMQIAKLLGRKP
jgi:hypothetical protein